MSGQEVAELPDAKPSEGKDCKGKKPPVERHLGKNLKSSHSILESEGRHSHQMEVHSCPRLALVLNNPTTETMLSFLVIFNLVIVVVETDAQAEDVDIPGWALVSNYALMVIFGIEISTKMMVYHIGFFKDPWCVMDFLVVFPDIILEIIGAIIDANISSLSFFRVLRLLRLGRAVRILSWFPELFSLVKGLAFAFRAIFWGTILILLILMIWSVMAVQFIQPLMADLEKANAWPGCARCSKAFNTVPRSMLTFIQQIVAGDSWGQVTVPIIEAHPLTSVFFVAVLVSVGLAILNLILAVIVDKADDAKQDSLRIHVEKKKAEQTQAKSVLKSICEDIDTDEGGHLSYDELIEGYTNHADFRDICTDMDITLEDMNVVWAMLDNDQSGEVSYDEFVDQLYKMKNDDSHTLLVFIKFYVGDIRKMVTDQIGLLREQILVELSDTHKSVMLLQDRYDGKPVVEVPAGAESAPSGQSDARAVEPKENMNGVNAGSVAGLEAEIARLREVNAEVLSKISKLFLSDDMPGEGTRDVVEKSLQRKRDSPCLEAEIGRLCDVNLELVMQIKNLNKQYEVFGGTRGSGLLDSSRMDAGSRSKASVINSVPPSTRTSCGPSLCSAPSARPMILPVSPTSILDDQVVPVKRT